MTRRFSHGFTLVELVMTLVIVGILALTAAPRFMSRRTFEALGFVDQAKTMLRYAQKTAIAQRRTVFVDMAINGTTLTAICLTYVANTGCADATPPNNRVLNPANRDWYRLNVPAGTAITTNYGGGNLAFDPLGRSSLGTLTITFTDEGVARPITIEGETGYVH